MRWKTRPVSWIKAAQKEFNKFPQGAKKTILTALTIAAEGQKADIAKPFKGVGSGVMEISLAYKGDAFRVIYALKLGDDIYVIHAFQKKSPRGIKTAQKDIDLIKDRIKRLKKQLK